MSGGNVDTGAFQIIINDNPQRWRGIRHIYECLTLDVSGTDSVKRGETMMVG